ncbi:hypothetical protein NL676_026375 [Syzygium grande]|nr:hypothetical protein NL676_026375 [Syzygium grande]
MKITQGIGRAPNYSCFPSLVAIQIFNCGLLDLSWLVHASELRELLVQDCSSMKKIIEDGFAREELVDSGLFSRLKSLTLIHLPKLTSICNQILSFSARGVLQRAGVPWSKKVAVGLEQREGKLRGRGDQRWWAGFEWDRTARVTLQVDPMGPTEEMTFGEAVCKLKDELHYYKAKIGFLPCGGLKANLKGHNPADQWLCLCWRNRGLSYPDFQEYLQDNLEARRQRLWMHAVDSAERTTSDLTIGP